MDKLHKGVLLAEAFRFCLAVCEATEAGEEEAMEIVWKDYSVEEQFALAQALACVGEGFAFIKMFTVLKMLSTPEMHSMTMSEKRACEILQTKRARIREHVLN